VAYFTVCDICGSIGHKAKACAVRELEARKDPFGEAGRREAYRRQSQARKMALSSSLPNAQSSPRFGS